jgi:hypothetical protein
MNYINFISERNYLLSSDIHNNELIDEDQDNICYLETKYGKNNLHNIIKSNRSYKNKFINIIDFCNDCKDSSPYTFLDNGLNCLTCTNQLLYLSKNEDKYAELVEKYIFELESLKVTLSTDIERSELKFDLKNLYKIKLDAYTKSLNYLIQYKNKICNNTKKILECYSLNENINQLIHKINITNIELVYILINILDKDTTEILDLLDEYKQTYNSEILKKVKMLEKKNILIEGFKNTKHNNLLFIIVLFLCILYLVQSIFL